MCHQARTGQGRRDMDGLAASVLVMVIEFAVIAETREA
jgi:hypothetical protein